MRGGSKPAARESAKLGSGKDRPDVVFEELDDRL